jgi:protein-disulfide isomerase
MSRSKTAALIVALCALVLGSMYGTYEYGKRTGQSQGYQWGLKKGRLEGARQRPPEPVNRGHSTTQLALAKEVAALGLEPGELESLAALMNRAPSPCGSAARRGVSLATALVDPTKACPGFAGGQARLALAASRSFDDPDEALAVLRIERRADLATDGRPSRGNPEAQVVLVEWADFQCPYCARSQELVEGLLSRREDVKVVFKHFPLSFHPAALPAALAVEAAREQDRFWEMHDALFALGKGIGKGIDPDVQIPEEGPVPFEQVAEDLGMDRARYRQDYRSQQARDRVEADRAEALRLGVKGTPSFFIGGRRVVERPSVDSFSALVDKALGERAGSFSWDLQPAP